MTHALVANMWMPSSEQLWLCAPELGLVGTMVAILIAPLIFGRNSYATALIVLLGVLGTSALAAGLASRLGEAGLSGLVPPGAAPMLLADNLSVFFKFFLMLFLAAVTTLWLIGSASRERHSPEFFVLLLASVLGMMLMVSTLNLLLIVIAIEMASLPSYAMAGFHKRNRKSSEASLKYVLFGSMCAAVMLYGISLLYGYYGSLDLGVIAERIARGVPDPAAPGQYLIAPGGNLVLAVGMLGLLVGIGFKISCIPFHFWCPDVFEGAPIEVTTWLSVSSKAAGLALLLRVVTTLATAAHAAMDGPAVVELFSPLAWVVGGMAAVTCTFANMAAYRQTSVRRLLAYSSIAHAGYMLMLGAILSNSAVGANDAVSALLAYILIYLFMNLGAFGTCALVSWHTGTDDLSAFTGLGRRAPWLALPMTVCLFSLVGMPPLGGFLAKWWLLVALGKSASLQPWLWGLVVVAAVNTLLSLFYYLKIVVRMYLKDDGQAAWHVPRSGLAIVNACAVVLVLMGTVLANPLKKRSDSYSTGVFTGAVTDSQLDAVQGQPAALASVSEPAP